MFLDQNSIHDRILIHCCEDDVREIIYWDKEEYYNNLYDGTIIQKSIFLHDNIT